MYNNGQMGAWGQNGGGMAMQGAPGSAGMGGGYAQPTPSIWPGEHNAAYQQSPAGFSGGQQGYRGYSYGSSGNQMLDMIQNMNMSNGMAGSVGARRSAQNSAPWATGGAGLEALIAGQGNAAHNINQGAFGYLQNQQAQQWQEHMANLQQELWKQRQPSFGQQLAGWGGQLAGTVAGNWLSPGGLWGKKGGGNPNHIDSGGFSAIPGEYPSGWEY